MRLQYVARGQLAQEWNGKMVEEKARILKRAEELRREGEQQKQWARERDAFMRDEREMKKSREVARNKRDRAIAQLLALTEVRTVNGLRHMVAKKDCLFATISLRAELEEYAAAARPRLGYPARPWIARPEYPEGALRGPVPRSGMKAALMGERARLEKFIATHYFHRDVLARLQDQLARVSERVSFMCATEIVKRTQKHEYARMEFRTMPRGWVGAA